MLYIRISETCKKRFNVSNENILEREREGGISKISRSIEADYFHEKDRWI